MSQIHHYNIFVKRKLKEIKNKDEFHLTEDASC